MVTLFYVYIVGVYSTGSQSPRDPFTENGFGTTFNSSSTGAYLRGKHTMSWDPFIVLTQSPVTVSAASGDKLMFYWLCSEQPPLTI